MLTTTHILLWLGGILLVGGHAYTVGGWRAYWAMLKKPVGSHIENDPRFWWWASPVTWLGRALLLLYCWRFWEGV